MKLNPPASSSDLDRARTIAQRLHDRGLHRSGDVPTARAAPPAEEASPPPPPPPPEEAPAPSPEPAFQPPDFKPPLPEEPAASEPGVFTLPEPEAPVEEAPAFRPADLEPPAPSSDTEPGLELEPDSAPPSPPAGDSPGPEVSPTEALELEPDAEIEIETESPDGEAPPPGTTDADIPPVDTPVFEPPEFEVSAAEEPELFLPDESSDGTAPSIKTTPDTGTWSPGDEPEDALGELTPPAAVSPAEELQQEDPFGQVPMDAVSPEDLLGDELAEPPGGPFETDEALLEPDAEEPGGAEDLTASKTPVWGDVADSCLAQAGAHGTMLVDPAGQVLTARGDWPEPGPDAIAGRLVSMMERTLQDAPTRSVSAPIAGRHLTAWRIPAGDGYLTVVFMGDAPLRTDVRPAIDDLIRGSLVD